MNININIYHDINNDEKLLEKLTDERNNDIDNITDKKETPTKFFYIIRI